LPFSSSSNTLPKIRLNGEAKMTMAMASITPSLLIAPESEISELESVDYVGENRVRIEFTSASG